MEKGKLSITDTTGKPIDSVVIEIPSEDAPKDKSIEVVKEDWKINAGYDYIIDAPGFKAAYLKGEDLNKKGGVQLKQTPIRLGTIPFGGDHEIRFGVDYFTADTVDIDESKYSEEYGRSLGTALEYLMQKPDPKIKAGWGYLMLTNFAKNLEKEGVDPYTVSIKTEPFFGTEGFRLSRKVFHEGEWKLPEEIEKDKGIESVAQHLQPINIFVGAGSESEPQTVKVGEIDTVVQYIDLERAFEVYLTPKSEVLRNLNLSETLRNDFERSVEVWQKYGLGGLFAWQKSGLGGLLDWVEEMEDFGDDPGVDAVDSFGFYISMPKKPAFESKFGWSIAFFDDPRSIQQSETFPNDPLFKSRGSWGQSYLDQWGLRRIGFKPSPERLKSLWPKKAKPVIVAVIDTGIDRSHPEISSSLWKNEKEIPNNGKDDDKNGYVDDVYGWNFVDKSNDIRDINGHGTITAGIIAALTNNKIGIAGVNPWAKIMPIKAMEWDGRGWAFDIAKAIIYAVNNGARVINISIGGKRLNRMELLAVNYARRKGVIVVAAAGNEGVNTKEFSPAGLPGVVTVAATGPDDKRVGYSGWGTNVDIAAPGVDILSLRAKRTDLLKFEKKDYKPGTAFVGKDKDYYRVTGTSFSAPFVSGVASLILSKNPKLSGMQVTRMILHSSRDIDMPGWDQFTGYGLLDAKAAMKADPDFYVLSRIFKVGGTKKEGKFFIEVSGRAMANNFKRAWIEAGQGNNPKEWVKVSDDITAPVNIGQLALIPPKHFSGAKEWTLRLIVEHQNGFKRESRFNLKLG
ncbi:MAG TPA: S8 family peptidase [Nitrospinota bacterium]|nr:S8 family peptidase [Nitrospinota bacterium]